MDIVDPTDAPSAGRGARRTARRRDNPRLPGAGTGTGRRRRAARGLEALRRPPPPDRRAAAPGVLRRRLQLRRDVPRDPGPGHQPRRQPLRAGRRPQAAARPLHLRGVVRSLRHDRAVVRARRRHAGGRAHRLLLALEARRRYGRRGGVARRDPVRRLDGRVRATGRSGRELRGVHAARDGRGGGPRAARQGAWARAPRSPSRRSPNRPASPRSSRSSTCSPVPGAAGASPTPPSASPFPSPWSRCWSGRVNCCSGRCSATVPTSASRRRRRTCSVEVRADDADVGRLQHPDPVQAAARVARPAVARRATDRSDTDLWLWFISGAVMVAIGLRFFGHYYMQIVPPLCLLTAGALVRNTGTRRVATTVGRVRGDVRARVLGGRILHAPFDPEPNYQIVSKYLADHTSPTTRSRCGAACPRSTGLRTVVPATRFVDHHRLPRRREPGPTGYRRRPEGRRPDHVAVLLRGPRRAPAALRDRHVAGPRSAARSTPRSASSRSCRTCMDEQYRYVRSIDKIAIYERR